MKNIRVVGRADTVKGHSNLKCYKTIIFVFLYLLVVSVEFISMADSSLTFFLFISLQTVAIGAIPTKFIFFYSTMCLSHQIWFSVNSFVVLRILSIWITCFELIFSVISVNLCLFVENPDFIFVLFLGDADYRDYTIWFV